MPIRCEIVTQDRRVFEGDADMVGLIPGEAGLMGVLPNHAPLLSTMSYLGLGLSPPTPDWGLMVSEGVGQLAFAPWLVLFPAVFISTLVIGNSLFLISRSSFTPVSGKSQEEFV